MRSLLAYPLYLLAASGLASATENSSDAESSVLSLTKDTFNSFIEKHDLVLAEFFAPWCGHCKALAPKYEEAASELKSKNIPLVKIDCTEEEELCKSNGVEGYPTLKVFRGLDSVKPYTGARQTEALVSYMIKQSLPAVSTVDESSIEEFKTMDKIVIIGYISPDDKANSEAFTKFAESQMDNYLFAISNDPAVAEAEAVQQPSIVLYKDFDEKKSVYDGKWAEDAIQSWAKVSSTPLVGAVNAETYSTYITAGIPLAYIFAETAEEREKFVEEFKPIAEKHRGAINIATIDAKLFGAHAGNLNLDPEKFPAFAIQDPEKNIKYPYDQSKEITAKDLGEFIQDVLDGKVAPSIKSEPVPETQEGPVTIVVAHNYKEIVIENEKDVLIEFYAPWCGHCKALAPKYEELGALYTDDLISKVTIAKVDATANDVPDSIAGFPTIRLYPAGAKDEPVEYTGSRTVEDLANFIKEKGTHKVDGLAAASKKAKDSEPAADSSSTQAADDKEEPMHDEL